MRVDREQGEHVHGIGPCAVRRSAPGIAARRGHAIFYYTDQPQDLLNDTPHGIITLEASTTVEPFSVGSKYLFCLRLLHAQQQRKRFTSKET
jgi:hypothetical protein